MDEAPDPEGCTCCLTGALNEVAEAAVDSDAEGVYGDVSSPTVGAEGDGLAEGVEVAGGDDGGVYADEDFRSR